MSRLSRGTRVHLRPPKPTDEPIVAVTVEDADGYENKRGSLHAFICSNGRLAFRAQKYNNDPVTVHIERDDATEFLRLALRISESSTTVSIDQTIQEPPA